MPDLSSRNPNGCITGGVSTALRAIGCYVAAPTPLIRANNVLALLVASNQPFYPFYVRFMAGPDGGATFLTLLTTPLFVAVPWLSRRSPRLALASVPVIGLANAALATLALGSSVGIDLFIVPCLAVAFLVADREHFRFVIPAALAMLAGFLLVHLADVTPLHTYSDEARGALYRLNALAVTGLTIYIVYSLAVARWRSG